jgi:hypothetical protein
MKDHFYQWLTNDKMLVGFLFMAVLLVWYFTREKELFRFLDMILSALFGWGAGKYASELTSSTTTSSTTSQKTDAKPNETK